MAARPSGLGPEGLLNVAAFTRLDLYPIAMINPRSYALGNSADERGVYV
jgi:hypothetical protein